MPTSASVFTKLSSGYMSVSKSPVTWDGILPQGPLLVPIRSPFANQISFSVTWASYDFHIRICGVHNWSHDKRLPRPLHSGPAAVVSTRWKWQHLTAHWCLMHVHCLAIAYFSNFSDQIWCSGFNSCSTLALKAKIHFYHNHFLSLWVFKLCNGPEILRI